MQWDKVMRFIYMYIVYISRLTGPACRHRRRRSRTCGRAGLGWRPAWRTLTGCPAQAPPGRWIETPGRWRPPGRMSLSSSRALEDWRLESEAWRPGTCSLAPGTDLCCPSPAHTFQSKISKHFSFQCRHSVHAKVSKTFNKN